MADQRPEGESSDTEVGESKQLTGDSDSRGRINASLRVNRHSFEARFKAALDTDDKELSNRFWSSVLRHLRCWLALAVIALFALGILAGVVGGQLRELLDALLR